MQPNLQTSGNSKSAIWTGRILSALAVLFLIFDGVIHLMRITPVVDSFNQLGLPLKYPVPIGIAELVCLASYIIPAWSVFGAILLTGYLGGAIAIQMRIDAPLFSTMLFPAYVGIMLWGGIFLRNNKLREIIPLDRKR